jgi:hypothetical protein
MTIDENPAQNEIDAIAEKLIPSIDKKLLFGLDGGDFTDEINNRYEIKIGPNVVKYI